MLYSLRYQKTQPNNIAALVNLLLTNGVAAEDARVGWSLLRHRHWLTGLQLVYVVLNIAGSEQRQDDLFSTESLLAKGRSALKGLKVCICYTYNCVWFTRPSGRGECLHTAQPTLVTGTRASC